MKIFLHSKPRGMALVIVMVTIFVLAALAGGLAYSMKVETKLARNANYDSLLTWTARSTVEVLRYGLGASLNTQNHNYDSLNEVWATGTTACGDSNSPFANIPNPLHLNGVTATWTIIDLERKFNINLAKNSPQVLEQAFILMGVDAGEYPQIVAAIQDWMDTDDDSKIGGAESRDYQVLTPSYRAKNGPIDDLSELLLVKGITPEMFYSKGSANAASVLSQSVNQFGSAQPASYSVGLEDLFTPYSSGRINMNTVSATTLQLIPGIDQNVAATIIQLRAGTDGADGTCDDTPFGGAGGSVQDALATALASRPAAAQMLRFFDTRSRTFEVRVTVEIGSYKKDFIAVIARNDPRDVQVLTFYAK